jgi:hypothetical protein
MLKSQENDLHKFGFFHIEANPKNDTNENADFDGVKIENAPYIEK